MLLLSNLNVVVSILQFKYSSYTMGTVLKMMTSGVKSSDN